MYIAIDTARPLDIAPTACKYTKRTINLEGHLRRDGIPREKRLAYIYGIQMSTGTNSWQEEKERTFFYHNKAHYIIKETPVIDIIFRQFSCLDTQL